MQQSISHKCGVLPVLEATADKASNNTAMRLYSVGLENFLEPIELCLSKVLACKATCINDVNRCKNIIAFEKRL